MGTNSTSGPPVRNFRIHLSYDGTNFSGWQVQPRLRTVQGEIERALAGLLGGAVRVHGSGRTDAGVHALDQVAHFRSNTALAAETIERALHGHLPRDIAALAVREAPDDFDARRSATARTYRYRIVRRRDPLRRFYAWEIRWPLDLARIAEATAHIEGSHDFTSFAASSRKGVDNVLTIRRAGWLVTEDDEIRFEVTANRFVHRYVRNVVGTLVDVGRGETEPGAIQAIREARDRTLAGPAAPAHGLYLVSVEYDTGAAPAGNEGETNEVLHRHGKR